MFLAQATFGVVPSGVDTDEVQDKIDAYLISLQKNGQICGDFLQSVYHGEVIAFAYAVRPDSMGEKFHCKYGVDELKAIRSFFQREPVWRLLADDVPTTFLGLDDCSSLYFFSSEYDGASPLCCGNTGERFPSYLIPIDDDERERLFFWSREYNRMDGIWFSSGELEIEAYRQLAAPTSLLAKQGRELASQVEAVTKKPVYYYLMRYYGRGDHELDRRCPGCGGEWRTKVSLDARNFWDFPFRCAVCRLVSHIANAAYDSAYAHFGEFQPESPIDASKHSHTLERRGRS